MSRPQTRTGKFLISEITRMYPGVDWSEGDLAGLLARCEAEAAALAATEPPALDEATMTTDLADALDSAFPPVQQQRWPFTRVDLAAALVRVVRRHLASPVSEEAGT